MKISVGRSRKTVDWRTKDVSWEQLVERMRTPARTQETMIQYANMSKDDKAAAKDVGGFVGGALTDGRRKAGHVVARELICLDADYDGSNVWDVWQLMWGNAALIHSTHSSTPSRPRMRLIIPLARPTEIDAYEACARYIANTLGMEAFDDTTYEAHRLMFWPSVPADAEYTFEACEGDLLDPDDVLARYDDWRDRSSWPVSSRQAEIVRSDRQKQGDPLQKPGVVGAFNRAYTITAAIARYIPDRYEPAQEGRWTYTGGSTHGGAVVYDDDTFIYSHHDTDPAGGRLCNAFDLVRLHLFGAEDAGHTRMAEDKLPSQKAMEELALKDEAVRVEMKEMLTIDTSALPFHEEAEAFRRFEGDTTDEGAATAFAEANRGLILFCPAFNWMAFDGRRWIPHENVVREKYRIYTDQLYSDAVMQLKLAGEDEAAKAAAKAYFKYVTRLRSGNGENTVLNLAKTNVCVQDVDRFDADPWLLNTTECLVDMRTGRQYPHDSDTMCTKITGCGIATDAEYNAGNPAYNEWMRFVEHISCGDSDLAEYLQTLCGMAAVGKVYEEGLIISYGPGGNGKSTFFGAVMDVLGDYAKVVDPEVLVGNRRDMSAVAALRGVRLAVMGETEEGAAMSASMMKRLCSRDRISARELYAKQFEFTPSHTLIIHTNFLPKLKSIDGGTKRRITVCNFPAQLTPARVVTDYGSQLVKRCGRIILRWVTEGARKFHTADHKLSKPAAVLQATNEYLDAEDWFANFIEDCCEIGEGYEVRGSDLQRVYKGWCESTGSHRRGDREFGDEMKRRGMKKVKSMSCNKWIGLRLAEEGEI